MRLISGRLRAYAATMPGDRADREQHEEQRGHADPRPDAGGRAGFYVSLALATALRTPLTKRPESSVEKRLARATASLIATAVGVSGRQRSSYVAISKSNRSIVGRRSIAQPSKSGLTMRSACEAYSSVPSASSSTNARC